MHNMLEVSTQLKSPFPYFGFDVMIENGKMYSGQPTALTVVDPNQINLLRRSTMAKQSLPLSNNSLKIRLELHCLKCGATHYKLSCQMGRGRGKFCSRSCASEFRQNGSLVKCVRCDALFYRRYGEQSDSKTQFCSRECYQIHRTENAKEATYLKTGAIHIHIVVAEKALGRKLTDSEVVHHIDENKHNNEIDNLAVLPNQKTHAAIHFGKNHNFEQFKLRNLMEVK